MRNDPRAGGGAIARAHWAVIRGRRTAAAALAAALMLIGTAAGAQTKPAPQKPAPQKPAPPRPAARPAEPIRVRAFGTLGQVTFQARDSFDAILGSDSGMVFGGGAQVILPSGFYLEVAASRFRGDGERVFVGPGEEVFRLGVPVEITVLPLDLTGGWRYRGRGRRGPWRLVPYGGAGVSSYRYEETSSFAESDDNVSERFTGFHVVGGADYRVARWVSVGGEVAWASVANAIGEAGVSAAFDEDNLGGTTIRLKVIIGR